MSQQDTKSSARTRVLQEFTNAVAALLEEKEKHYGFDGGFYETNNPSQSSYTHALGEAKLKLSEFERATATFEEIFNKRPRLLIKAAAWIYLIYESELVQHGPK